MAKPIRQSIILVGRHQRKSNKEDRRAAQSREQSLPAQLLFPCLRLHGAKWAQILPSPSVPKMFGRRKRRKWLKFKPGREFLEHALAIDPTKFAIRCPRCRGEMTPIPDEESTSNFFPKPGLYCVTEKCWFTALAEPDEKPGEEGETPEP